MIKKLFFLSIFLSLAILSPPSSDAAPDPDIWKIWQNFDADNTFQPDNILWEAFLADYLIQSKNNRANLVRYSGVTEKDRKKLGNYITYLESIDPGTLNRNEQKAYWINLYNALTVKIILDNYPVKSIRKISPSGLFKSGPWNIPLAEINNTKVSLNDIEHRILRPIWKDPAIHYAVNCASIGCPNLQREPYTGSNIDRLLKKGAYEYINSKRALSFKKKKIVLSSIFKWFSKDFGKSEKEILNYISDYIEDNDKKESVRKFSGKIIYRYNWDLNGG